MRTALQKKKTGEEFDITIFDGGETIHGHAQPKDFTPPNPNMITLVTDSNNEESVSDKHTFQIEDDIYEKIYLNLIFNTHPIKLSFR